MKSLYILFISTIILTGCRPAASNQVPEKFSANSETGLIVGTITFEGDKPVNDIYRFFYEPTKGDKKFIRKNDGKIEIKARVKNESAYNGDFNENKTYLFVIETAPGSYAFNQYNYLDHIGYTGTVSSSKKFAIPFDVKAGQITYIGELTYKENATPGEPRIYIWDKFSRDITKFKNKYPQINWELAINNTVKSGDDGNGIISFMESEQ